MSGHGEPARDDAQADRLAEAEGWLEQHGDALFRYARARVGRRELAEDLVQETLLAALSTRSLFRGEASVRTWLIGILRRKIVDAYRRRELNVQGDPDLSVDPPRSAVETRVFSENGFFQRTPATWRSPADTAELRELAEILSRCVARRPTSLAVAFTLRKLDELPVNQIQEQLGVSPGNLRVRLYRARLLLRECLETHWFSA